MFYGQGLDMCSAGRLTYQYSFHTLMVAAVVLILKVDVKGSGSLRG